ncbi:MAG: DUF2341 domain-containing protein [Myxococcota bacterium]
MRRLLLLAVVLAACAEDAGSATTTIEVAVRFGSHLDLDRLTANLVWDDQSETATKDILPHVGPPIDRLERLSVVVPDEFAAVPGQLQVDGLRDQDIVARAELVVTASRAQAALVDVTLVPGSEIVAPPFERWRFETLQAAGPDPAEVVSVRVEPSSGERLLFVSGALSRAEAGLAEVRLRLDGEEIDRFSHDLRGGLAARAGFVTFDVLPAGPGRQLSVDLVSPTTSQLSDLRIVTVPVPPGADLTTLRDDDNQVRNGRDLALSSLSIDRSGQYLVLAKMSLTEGPSDHTARGWLTLPDGSRRPLDERGVTFSASRASLSPLFTAVLIDVPPEGATFQLGGHSSGTGEPTLNGWARPDADFRQPITVDVAPEGYAVRLVFDHAAEVAQNRSLPDGRDVAIFYEPTGGTPVGLHRVLDPDSGWNRPDTTVWFRTPVAVPDAGSTEFAMYFEAAADVRADPAEVFPFFDDFSSAEVTASQWRVLSGAGGEVLNGRLIFDAPGIRVAGPISPEGARWEARLRLFEEIPTGLAYLVAGNDFQLTPDEFVFDAGLYAVQGGHFATVQNSRTQVRLDDPLADHIYAVDRRQNADVRFFQDDLEMTSIPQAATQDATWTVALINRGTSGASYDWVRARPYIEPEPGLALGALAGGAGVLPSTFRYRKMVAVRADAWGAANIVEGASRETTTEPYRALVSRPLSAADAPRLVIASARVAGGGNPDAARGGRVSLGERVLLETSHRIDRDASDRSGYHHIAGVAEVVTGTTTGVVEVGIASPDGINVGGADARIIVLELSP